MSQTTGNNKPFFYRFSVWVTKATGRPGAFLLALMVIIIWAVSGYFFQFSETWQLVINTGTTIITFLMIFIIQQSQNRDTAAIHLKLNELIASNKDASNRLVKTEELSEKEQDVIKEYYQKISDENKNESVFASHSLDEAERDSNEKKERSNKINHQTKN